MTQVVERELAADGVAADGYGMLSLIGVRGPVRLTELAGDLGLPLTTASDIVRRLEAKRYVRRHANPDDARSWLFELSAAGDREWRRGFGALQRITAHLAAELGNDAAVRETLIGLDRAFASALTDV